MEFKRINYYNKVIEELNSKNDRSEELFWAYIERGMIYFELVEYNKAISDFESAISLMPDEAIGYYNLGIIYYHRKELDKSLEYFKKVIELEPDNGQAYYQMGLILNLKNEYLSAVNFFSEAVNSGRKTADVFYNRALSYIKLSEFEKAMKDLDTALKIKPSNSDYYLARASLNLNLKNYKDALKDFTSLIKLKPDFSSYRFDRAVLYATVGSWFKTVESVGNKESFIYKKSVELSSGFDENSDFYYNLARYDIDFALDNEAKICGFSGVSPSFYLTRGAILLSMGKKTEAELDFVLAKKNIKIFSFETLNEAGSKYVGERYYLIKALVCLYLGEYETAKKELDRVLNMEIFSSRLDILYACYWWKAEKDFEKTNFWFERSLRNGFDIINVIDDIFEGYFLRDFLHELEKKKKINF